MSQDQNQNPAADDDEFDDGVVEDLGDDVVSDVVLGRPDYGDAKQDDEAPDDPSKVSRGLVAGAGVLPMAKRIGKAAAQWGRAQIKGNGGWKGLCYRFSRECFEVPALQPRAIDGWTNADNKHRYTSYRNVARFTVFFYSFGSGQPGHAVVPIGLDTDGDRLCLSTDVVRTGFVNIVKMRRIEEQWGAVPLGWVEDINEVRIYRKPQPKPKDTPHFDKIIEEARLGLKATNQTSKAKNVLNKIIDLAKPFSTGH